MLCRCCNTKPILKEAKFDHDNWVIIIGVTGEMRGQVLIGMTEETACAIASKMCMMEVKTIDDFASSAIGELGNMIMGNAAIVFSSNGVGIDITPPTLSHGEVSLRITLLRLCACRWYLQTAVEVLICSLHSDRKINMLNIVLLNRKSLQIPGI